MAVGAVLFKALEGRVMTVQLDLLVMFGIACGLVGYQIAVATTVVHVENNCPPNVAFSYKPKGKTKETGGRGVDEPEHPPKRRERPSLRGNRSNGSLDIQESRSKSLALLRSSMKSTKGVFDQLQGKEAVPKEETPIVPAKTFAKFPDGAALGAHLNCWSSPPSNNFMVRGPNYLKDKKKVPSGDYLLPSRGCDLFLTDLAPVNLGRNRSLLEGRLRDVPTFIINYRLPWGVFLSYHEIPERFIPFLRRGNGHGDLSKPLPSTSNMPPGDRALCDFFLSDSHEKDAVWKIVPVVAQGPWMVKKVVGGKPAILGKQMPVSYVYQPPENGLAEYLEADLDIVSSAAARKILAVVRSYTQVLTVDLGFVVQGNRTEELPEQMMLGLRLHGLDPLTAELLPEFDDGSSMLDMDEDTEHDSD
eukprot:CAMPEP_0201632194 /NCGR_PEP_ID=MMETSP0493-20130528/5914_1 /ASSEMBLY_ACC=CAM_ASM_000838 /TAXON_ID=420259 /ORGANISM="Thalassiosira gravida, Strain GMp14c1" /LENGTH=416 /DNA_ID=CAMNT_0048103667 /DNA_START=98 /DNA_END=1348 /DNA_ORIENTATION=-